MMALYDISFGSPFNYNNGIKQMEVIIMAKVALVTGASSEIGRYRYDYRRYCFSAGVSRDWIPYSGIYRMDRSDGKRV